VGSGVYTRAILALRPDATVIARPCPLFVPLAEEGWVDGEIAELVARRYLEPLLTESIDTLVLGCTHYPMLVRTLAKVAGPNVALVDSAEQTALAVDAALPRADASSHGEHRFLVTDSPERFREVGTQFFGRPLEDVSWINLNVCRTKKS